MDVCGVEGGGCCLFLITCVSRCMLLHCVHVLPPYPTLHLHTLLTAIPNPIHSLSLSLFHSLSLSQNSVQNGEPPTVQVVANLFRELCYGNKDALQAGIIVAGWDPYHGGEVYSIPLGGSLHKQPFAIGGRLQGVVGCVCVCVNVWDDSCLLCSCSTLVPDCAVSPTPSLSPFLVTLPLCLRLSLTITHPSYRLRFHLHLRFL